MAGSLELADFEHLKQNDQILKLNTEESSHTYCGPTLSRLSSSIRTRAEGELGGGYSELGTFASL